MESNIGHPAHVGSRPVLLPNAGLWAGVWTVFTMRSFFPVEDIWLLAETLILSMTAAVVFGVLSQEVIEFIARFIPNLRSAAVWLSSVRGLRRRMTGSIVAHLASGAEAPVRWAHLAERRTQLGRADQG